MHYDAQKQHDVIATIAHKKRKTNISLHTRIIEDAICSQSGQNQ